MDYRYGSHTVYQIEYHVSKDHVHILVSAPPNMAPSEIMRRIKGRTASYLFEEFPSLKKRYWGAAFLGARLFLCHRWAND